MIEDTTSDPWAWARESEQAHDVDPTELARIGVIVVAHDGQRWVVPALESLAAQSVPPRSIVVVDAGSSDETPDLLAQARLDGKLNTVVSAQDGASFGESVARGIDALAPECDWLWLLHDDVTAAPEALERLYVAAQSTKASMVGPLLVEPRRRGAWATQISEVGQTVTDEGFVTGVIAEGVHDQGQLDGGPVLGISACGMLVRRSVWDEMGGFDTDLPSVVQGLEFCWRARAAGHVTVTQPRARLVHWESSMRGLRHGIVGDPVQQRRRWGLTLHEAYRTTDMATGESARLAVAASRRAAGLVVSKNIRDARLERQAIAEWKEDRAAVERLHERFLSVATAPSEDIDALRITRKAMRARAVDEAFGRVVDWAASFGDRGGGPGIESLTGDDFAREEQRKKVSPVVVATWLFIVGAFIAARTVLWGEPLSGPQLLPVPDTFDALWQQYVNPVAGADPSSGAPWVALVWLASLVTFGHPDLVVSVLLLGAVPLSFLLGRRALARFVEDRWVALTGAAAYAMVPVVSGAVGSGQLGTVLWIVLLPVLANLLITWWEDGDPSWSTVGAVAATALGMVSVEPLTWVPIAIAIVGVAYAAVSKWKTAIVAALGPAVVLVSPHMFQWIHYPGRLLTGIEPQLAPATGPSMVAVLGCRIGEALPPLWISALFVGVLWLLAIAGTVVKPRMVSWPLAVALVAAALALGINRLVVAVPPGGALVRPQAAAWQVIMVTALIVAACFGLGGVRAAIQSHAFGFRQALMIGAALVATTAVVVTSGWWVVAGYSQLERREGTPIPAFIRKEAVAGVSRTLAIDLTGQTASWTILEGNGAKLGASERGIAFGGKEESVRLAESLVRRIVMGISDERVVPDLQHLGIGHIWVKGATSDQRVSIGNTPGLGLANTDAQGSSWTVPESGRLVLSSKRVTAAVEAGRPIPAGDADRVLLVAEPSDPTLVATLDGRHLTRLPDVAGRPAFAMPTEGGSTLSVTLDRPFAWWVVVQAIALVGLMILAAPTSASRRGDVTVGPRRARGERA